MSLTEEEIEEVVKLSREVNDYYVSHREAGGRIDWTIVDKLVILYKKATPEQIDILATRVIALS